MTAHPHTQLDITILICDDNEGMRDVLRGIVGLDPRLRVVGEAADGAIGIQEAIRLQPDVILLDLAMPVLSGLAALPRLRTLVPDARIIVLSGFSTAVVGRRVLELGASLYLEKGADPRSIIAAITQVAAGVAPAAPPSRWRPVDADESAAAESRH